MAIKIKNLLIINETTVKILLILDMGLRMVPKMVLLNGFLIFFNQKCCFIYKLGVIS